MFAANLFNAVENNTKNISTVPVNLLKVVDLLSKIANFSKANSVAVDQNTMEVCTFIIYTLLLLLNMTQVAKLSLSCCCLSQWASMCKQREKG